jgi:mannose/fructose/N-acetylgalactosamine-specific phosphotransferase system component IIC
VMEAKITFAGGLLLLALGLVALFWSKVVAIPLGVMALWFAVSLFINSYQFLQQARQRRAEGDKLSASSRENAPVLPQMKTDKNDS